MLKKFLRAVLSPSEKGKLYWKIVIIALVTVIAGSYDYPRFYDAAVRRVNKATGATLSEFKKTPFHLGLDLQGGTHLVYQADVSAISARAACS